MKNNKPGRKSHWVKAVIAGIVLGVLISMMLGGPSDSQAKKVPLSVALAQVDAGKVAKATIDDQTNQVTLTATKAAGGKKITAQYPFAYSGELTKALLAKNVKTETAPLRTPNRLVSALIGLLPILLLVGLTLWLVKSDALTGGIGKFKGKRGEQLGKVPDTRFDDVAGCDEAVTELRELVEFLSDGERFVAVGAKAPRGALLVGPPGTGKTLLARAVAGEAGVPFFPIAGSDFVETFVGVGAKRVRDIFDKARQAGKAIIFIDEIDAVGKARSGGPSHGGDSERENTLISMLNEMDGFDSSHVIVLAATNRADVLDEALTRPGRLDRQIQVPNPDRLGRTDILKVHTRGKPLGGDVDLVSIARQTPGMSGAELAQVVNEACMEAARAGVTAVTHDHFQAAIASVALGRARTSALVTDHDRLITAWHEGGHTVAALLLEHADDPVSVTIVPRGPAGGVTWMSGNDNTFLTRQQALASLTVSLAGRAAEEILLDGEFTQGAVGDLQAATGLARQMVTQYGMTRFGYTQIDAETLRVGGEVAIRAHEQIEALLVDAHRRATDLLAVNGDFLRELAQTLLVEETLSAARVKDLYAKVEAARVSQAVFDSVATSVKAQRSAQDHAGEAEAQLV